MGERTGRDELLGAVGTLVADAAAAEAVTALEASGIRCLLLLRGPVVTHGFDLLHKIVSPIREEQIPSYAKWRSLRLQELRDPGWPSRRDTLTVMRAHQGGTLIVYWPSGANPNRAAPVDGELDDMPVDNAGPRDRVSEAQR
jgi:hypothetical protein